MDSCLRRNDKKSYFCTMLKVQNIFFSYSKNKTILDNFSFNLKEGEHLCIMGESGCGKSTLLKVIYGLLDLQKGTIFWKETQVLGPKKHLVPGMGFFKYVAQDFDLMPYISVSENIKKFLSRFYPEESEARTQELLEVIEMKAFKNTKADLPIGLGYLDSVKFYLDSAIKVCVENDVREHLPTLLREQGLVYVESSMHDTGRSLLMNAADVFIAQGDTENYVGTLVHVSRSFNNEKIYSKSDSLSRYLWNIVKSRNWYSIKLSLSELFESIALVNEDSISFLKWKLISKEQLFLRSQETMAFKDYKAFNEMHLLNKSKSDFLISKLEEKEEALYLKEEAAKKNRFLFYFILSGTIALTIGLLFFRERTLKRRIYRTNKSLSKANDNYRLLMLESNHRIKNNLQMILSLVRYAKINQGKKGDVIIDDLSNKIHVISSLHEQLTMSSHGEEVDLKVYIETIVNHYKRFSILEKKVDLTLDSVEINNERIVYFGLILNELLSNTIAHSKSNSEINIKLIKKENKFLFFYSDGSNFENSKMTGTGTELIKELLDRIQVSETIMNKKTGTYSFKFSA